jgi:integrase
VLPEHPTTARKSSISTRPNCAASCGVLAGPRDRALFPLAYHHGLRASEVSLLLRDDLNAPTTVKGSRSGVYPLEPLDLRRLRAYLSTRQDD